MRSSCLVLLKLEPSSNARLHLLLSLSSCSATNPLPGSSKQGFCLLRVSAGVIRCRVLPILAKLLPLPPLMLVHSPPGAEQRILRRAPRAALHPLPQCLLSLLLLLPLLMSALLSKSLLRKLESSPDLDRTPLPLLGLLQSLLLLHQGSSCRLFALLGETKPSALFVQTALTSAVLLLRLQVLASLQFCRLHSHCSLPALSLSHPLLRSVCDETLVLEVVRVAGRSDSRRYNGLILVEKC
mmetsp:Transcript_37162/g.81557  ORF Transcript_37162/g.81557 Transcript_37162/m.81557 type:complete len:240 (+) Transcript_37162:262-981(+)